MASRPALRARASERTPRVASVLRALQAIEAIAGARDGLALTDLTARLGCGIASLSKVLSTIERAGFVARDPATNRFRLSWRLLALAFGHARDAGLLALCLPGMQALADATDELVQLVVVEDGELRIVAKAEGPGRHIRMMPLVGVTVPAHASVSGKLWLASLPDDEVVRILARTGLPRVTPHTIVSRRRLMAELRLVRARGWSLADEELVEGGRAVAAPIRRAGRVVAALAVSGPTFRMPFATLRRIVPLVRRAAAELEAVWPPHATSADFGLVVPGLPAPDRASRRRAPAAPRNGDARS